MKPLHRVSFCLCASAVLFTMVAPVSRGTAARQRGITCLRERPTIVGTKKADKLFGTPRRDVIVGLGGNDVIVGLEQVDAICGNAGNDRLVGGAGFDGLAGGPGNDTLIGKAALDFLNGGAGNDTLKGGGGKILDLLIGGKGDDEIDGGAGDDLVAYYASGDPVTVDLPAGEATGEGTDTLVSVEGAIGSNLSDTLTGGGEDNLFYGGRGDDSITGGGGMDVVGFRESGAVTVDLVAGNATGDGSDTLDGIESVEGSPEGDTIIGDAGVNEVFAMGGDDSVSGDAGDDLLHGGEATDTLDGGDGTDVCLEGETLSNCESDSVAGTHPGLRLVAALARHPFGQVLRALAGL